MSDQPRPVGRLSVSQELDMRGMVSVSTPDQMEEVVMVTPPLRGPVGLVWTGKRGTLLTCARWGGYLAAKISDLMLRVRVGGPNGKPSLDMFGDELCRILCVGSFVQSLPILSSPQLDTRSRSIPGFERSSVANTTAAMSPVGMRYTSRPWASFRSQWLLACWYSKAATGRARGSQPSLSSF